jgi:N-acetylglucosamine-6-sulfatase
MGKDLKIYQSLPDEEYKKEAYQLYMKRYLRCIKGVNDNLKRILHYLEKEVLMDNTIIIYTGDQGFLLGKHDLIDKRWMYEESLRMPLLIRYPKLIKPGTKNGWIINNTDFAPTTLELAGLPKPAYMQGKSFIKALIGSPKSAGWRQVHYYRYWMHMAHNQNNPAHFGIRTDRYKLIFFYDTDFLKTGE